MTGADWVLILPSHNLPTLMHTTPSIINHQDLLRILAWGCQVGATYLETHNLYLLAQQQWSTFIAPVTLECLRHPHRQCLYCIRTPYESIINHNWDLDVDRLLQRLVLSFSLEMQCHMLCKGHAWPGKYVLDLNVAMKTSIKLNISPWNPPCTRI